MCSGSTYVIYIDLLCVSNCFYVFLHVERWRISAPSNEVLQWQLHGRKGVAQGCEEQNRAAAETWRADTRDATTP